MMHTVQRETSQLTDDEILNVLLGTIEGAPSYDELRKEVLSRMQRRTPCEHHAYWHQQAQALLNQSSLNMNAGALAQQQGLKQQ